MFLEFLPFYLFKSFFLFWVLGVPPLHGSSNSVFVILFSQCSFVLLWCLRGFWSCGFPLLSVPLSFSVLYLSPPGIFPAIDNLSAFWWTFYLIVGFFASATASSLSTNLTFIWEQLIFFQSNPFSFEFRMLFKLFWFSKVPISAIFTPLSSWLLHFSWSLYLPPPT